MTDERKPLHAMHPVDAATCDDVTFRAHMVGAMVSVRVTRPPGESWSWYMPADEAAVLADRLESLGRPNAEVRGAAIYAAEFARDYKRAGLASKLR